MRLNNCTEVQFPTKLIPEIVEYGVSLLANQAASLIHAERLVSEESRYHVAGIQSDYAATAALLRVGRSRWNTVLYSCA